MLYSVAGDFLSITVVLRDCRSEIPVEAAGQIPIKITDQCFHVSFNYDYEGINLPINGTVCPCFTSLCNAGNITFGGTAGSGSPSSTVSSPSWSSFPTTPSTSTSAGATNDPRDHRGGGRSSAKMLESHPVFIVATLLAVILH